MPLVKHSGLFCVFVVIIAVADAVVVVVIVVFVVVVCFFLCVCLDFLTCLQVEFKTIERASMLAMKDLKEKKR